MQHTADAGENKDFDENDDEAIEAALQAIPPETQPEKRRKTVDFFAFKASMVSVVKPAELVAQRLQLQQQAAKTSVPKTAAVSLLKQNTTEGLCVTGQVRKWFHLQEEEEQRREEEAKVKKDMKEEAKIRQEPAQLKTSLKILTIASQPNGHE